MPFHKDYYIRYSCIGTWAICHIKKVTIDRFIYKNYHYIASLKGMHANTGITGQNSDRIILWGYLGASFAHYETSNGQIWSRLGTTCIVIPYEHDSVVI